jgi:glyoxylase-like metal-dependent hydrolase (beta-lactamase superfamily II)
MRNHKISIGDVEIISISDAAIDHPLDLEHLFPEVAASDWEPYQQAYPDAFGRPNVWRVQFGGYVLRSQGRVILVDTGLGPAGATVGAYSPTPIHVQPAAHLLENLQAAGVSPNDVDTVVLTHLHADHVGWNIRSDRSQASLTFPRARYIIHELDWRAFAVDGQRFSWIADRVTPLAALRALDLTSSDRSITGEVTALHTPGHTPGHMSVLIVSNGHRAIITGDVLVNPAQVAEARWRFAADMNHEEACKTRYRLLERIEAERMTVAARHFPEPGFGQVMRLAGRRYWQAL